MRTFLTAAALAATLATPLAQAPAPAFEAVSVKRSTSDLPGPRWGTGPGGGFSMTNGATLNVIYSGYTLKNTDIVGLPEWARTERYDVIGATLTPPTRAEREAMVRQLLAERFKMRAHVESREQPVYALVVARPDRALPPALRRISVDCAALSLRWQNGSKEEAPLLPSGEPACGYNFSSNATGTVLTANGITMASLADRLDGAAGRIVVDRSGLAGDYAFTLTYNASPSATTGVTIFTALQDLGLKLESARAAVETLVIDHIERPTED